jgi:glycosyltransferase involved in cell wall biosynthesis
MRIALLTEIPAPFRIPLWNALAALPGVELRVLLLREHDPRRQYPVRRAEWRFDGRVLPGREVLVGQRWLVATRGLARELASFAPDVVIAGGWNQPAFLQASRYARRRRTPLVLWVESTRRDPRPPLGQEAVKRRLLARAAGTLVPGRAAADYVRGLGVPGERIAVAPNAFDVASFQAAVDACRATRERLRAELGVEGCCFLTVSRLSREKGVDLLAGAFADVPALLLVAGSGPHELELRRTAPPNVRFLGHVERERLPRLYAAADAFALASRSETWGMAVSEAAAAGLPLVVSEGVGAGWDLVEPGVNGFRVPAGDAEGLREALRRLAADPALRGRAFARSRELVADATPEAWAAAVDGLARRVVES